MQNTGLRDMEFREILRWRPDNKPETDDCVVLISECGKIVKRLKHKRWCAKNNQYSIYKEKIYSITTNRGKQRYEPKSKKIKHGEYSYVEIKNKTYSIHRLVAQAFVENPENLPCVNHIDGNRSNNHFSNLQWVTNDENVKHAWETGLRNIQSMRKLPFSEMKNILSMRESGLSYSKIGKKYGMAGESIRHRVKQYENGLRC